MKKQPALAIPEVPGIDLSYRPQSYFWPLDLDTHLLARIKGAERKAALSRLIDSGNAEEIPEFLTQSALSDEDREMFGRFHPAFMGGEYLPNLTSHEVQIARVTIASTTQDVTSVYARRTKYRIVYRVVDEYEGDTLSEKRTRTSIRPLTLGELATFLDGAWSIYGVLAMNFGDKDLEAMLEFVIGVDSQFYPQLDALYRRRIEDWASVRRGDLGRNHSESEDTEAPSQAQDKEPVKPIKLRSLTPEEYETQGVWSIGPVHRAPYSQTAPEPETESKPPQGLDSLPPKAGSIAHASAIDRVMKANPTLTREAAEEMAKALGF